MAQKEPKQCGFDPHTTDTPYEGYWCAELTLHAPSNQWRVQDIDWQERKCKVIGKGGKQRTVYFSVRAKLMLQLYIEGRKGGEALFSSSRAPYEPLSDRGIEKIISKLGKRIGMERPLYPHLMRHTFASHALSAGMDLTVIQHLLGHTDPKTTLIYAEINPIRVQYEYNRVIA